MAYLAYSDWLISPAFLGYRSLGQQERTIITKTLRLEGYQLLQGHNGANPDNIFKSQKRGKKKKKDAFTTSIADPDDFCPDP